MDLKEKLGILNKIACVDYDSDGETLYYFLIKNNHENLDLLLSVGVPENELLNEAIHDEGCIDIKDIAFDYCGAEWYDSELGWIDYRPY